uniref:Uncharacterized protein n=1 Tax=Arundo donax TaxID=35708 RepID=A0A0A9BPL1_ARUDO
MAGTHMKQMLGYCECNCSKTIPFQVCSMKVLNTSQHTVVLLRYLTMCYLFKCMAYKNYE